MNHNTRLQVNRYGFQIIVGQTVRFHTTRSGVHTGVVKAFDSRSDYARAYGVQVTFSDSPWTVAIDDCFAP